MTTLDIYFDKQSSPGVMAAKLWISSGSRYDPQGQKGAHQLLGSLLCRGCGPYDFVEIGDRVEGCGACLNCETYQDGLLISLKCIQDDVFKLLPILGWMIKEPHIDENQVNIEKELTIQALGRQKEDPFYVAFDGWRRLAYGEGPYAHDPLGRIKDLKLINKKELIPLANSISKTHKVLVISGSYPLGLEQQIIDIKPFDSLLREDCAEQHKAILDNCTQKKESTIQLQIENTSQIVLMLGNTTISYSHPDAIHLQLLSCYLGSGMSSKLFIELREKHGVAYDVGVHHPIRENNSPFVIHASTSKEKSIHALELLHKCLEETLEKQLSEKELTQAKAKYRGQIAHFTQTVSQKAERKAHLLGLKLNINHDQNNLDRLEDITIKDVLNSARRYLQQPLLSLCGPKKTLTKMEEKWISF